MNLLFVCNTRHWGGGEKYIIDVALGLARRGHTCRIAANDGSPLHREADVHEELETLPFKLGPKLSKKSTIDFLLHWRSQGRRIATFLAQCRERFPIDLVHFQYKKEQLLGTPAAHRLGLPVVWTEHDRLPRSFTAPVLPVALYRRSGNLARRIICVSRFGARDLESRGIAPERIVVCHNGIEVGQAPTAGERAAARAELGLDENHVAIGTTSRLVRNKGHRFLLDAVRTVQQRHAGLHVVIMGDGPARNELERQVGKLEIDGRVTFTGHLRDVRRLLPALDVFVLPSQREGMPFSVLEAMGADVPVVATTVGGVPEIIQDGVNGLLVPVGDAPGLGGAIDTLLADAGRRASMRTAARRDLRARFSIESMIDCTERALMAAGRVSSTVEKSPLG
jgi:glycosyltransferase involved in cell wall biosynthesis